MTVTIAIESNPTTRFEFECVTQNVTVGPFPSVEDAQLGILVHVETCVDCADYAPLAMSVWDVEASVNLSNTNALTVFTTLGLSLASDDGELYGVVPANTLLAAAHVALASDRRFDARATVVQSNTGGAHLTDCGVNATYVTERITELADLATEAVRLGRDITWS
jgi:hypothetical protein